MEENKMRFYVEFLIEFDNLIDMARTGFIHQKHSISINSANINSSVYLLSVLTLLLYIVPVFNINVHIVRL